jgi:precorrin-2 dehydrogenase/sirohydrochlorin ferrochelatase
MRHYPAFLDLRRARCLLVGLGGVGRRKLATLLECEPVETLVLDPGLPDPPPEEAAALLARPGVILERRAPVREDLEGRTLLVAATSDPETNLRLAQWAEELRVLCNVIDEPEAGSFIVPASIRMDELTVAVSTAGGSPALARRIKQDLQEYLGLRYASLLTVMGRLRPLVLELEQGAAHNAALFRSLVASPLAAALEVKDEAKARALLAELLPAPLRPRINEVLHGLI